MTTQEAIERLKQNKEKCRKFDAFGGNNQDAVQAMIDTLENDWGDEEIYKQFPDDDDDENTRTAALSILQAKDEGFENLEDYLYPEV